MNVTVLQGRLTKDVELKTSSDGKTSVARFTVAVDRKVSKDGNKESDFISCVAFNKTAEFVSKFFHKGQRIALNGRIQTGNYTKQDGTKVYTTDVVAENVEFCEVKLNEPSHSDDFVPADSLEDDGLPFN